MDALQKINRRAIKLADKHADLESEFPRNQRIMFEMIYMLGKRGGDN